MTRLKPERGLVIKGRLPIRIIMLLLCACCACSSAEKKADPLYRALKAMESPGSADARNVLKNNKSFTARKDALDFHKNILALWNSPEGEIEKKGAAEALESSKYAGLLEWETARAYLRAAMPRKAMNSMEKIRPAHSSGGLYWLERSEALIFDLRMNDALLESFSRAVELQDAPVYAYFLEEAVYSAMNKYAQALEATEAALKLRSDVPYFYYRKGRACAVLGKHRCALEAYKKIENIHPKSLFQMAESYFVLGEYDKAIEYYERLLRHYPKHRLILKQLGQAYMAAGRYSDAEEILREDIGLKPRDYPGYILLAEALYLQGEYRNALGVLEKALEMNPNLPRAHVLKGKCLMKLGENDRAGEEFKWMR